MDYIPSIGEYENIRLNVVQVLHVQTEEWGQTDLAYLRQLSYVKYSINKNNYKLSIRCVRTAREATQMILSLEEEAITASQVEELFDHNAL